MKLLMLLLLLIPGSCWGKSFTVAWDPSATSGVTYRVYIGAGTDTPTLHTTTPSTSVVVDLPPNSYTLYVESVLYNVASNPSNTWRIPAPATTVQGASGIVSIITLRVR